MFEGQIVKVIIPAGNDAESIGKVIGAIGDWVDEVIVVNNGSTDGAVAVAGQAGARVIAEPRSGYGQACLTGMASLGRCDIVVFLDDDFSDYPEEMERLVRPIADDRADMVIGTRTQSTETARVLTLGQRFGNALACYLMRIIWRSDFTDLGPFRAIRHCSLRRLAMNDRNFGWTIEMQIKAVRARLRVTERAVSYRQRIGRSKISGTLSGVIGAGSKILWTIFRQAASPPLIPRTWQQRVIVFTRYPLPGRAKTRLIPALGATGAAMVQRLLTRRTLEALESLGRRPDTEIEVQYAGGTGQKVRRWLGPGRGYVRQVEGDLGQRMHGAFARAYANGCQRAVIVGTDCPGLRAEHIEQAYAALTSCDVVLGPSGDGGYWLIGLRQPERLFEGMDWGNAFVLADTLDAARRQGLSLHLLEQLDDIDHIGDLERWQGSDRSKRVYISVIIPALNEAERIEAAIQSAQCDGAEILVADGGSSDTTVRIAEAMGARVVHCPAGRARQLDQAAREATGEVLLFLHADTILPSAGPSGSFVEEIFDLLGDGQIVGGAFGFQTDWETAIMWALERIVNFRTWLLGTPYGDQAIFVRKSIFDDLGGFGNVALAEDLHLVKRLRRRGRMVILPRKVITSGRRWRKLGPVRTTAINQFIVASLSLGVPAGKLAAFYRRQFHE